MKELDHIINHFGEERSQYFNAVAPPLMQSSNFAFQTVAAMREGLKHEMDKPFYTRGHNPTVAILQQKIAALEGTEACLTFGSGSAAIAAAVMSAVKGGEHVVAVQKPYSWTFKLLDQLLSKYHVTVTWVDGRDPENFRAAVLPNTRLFILESPNSMTFELQDIQAVCEIAKQHSIATLIDNSYATPLNQRPANMGADMVMHSASKYLNGHSDLVAGVLCCSRERAEAIFASEFMTLGGILAPHEAWLILRGLRTLPLRMQRVAESTPKVVEFLANHPKVDQVLYPHHPSFPQYELALRQIKAPAGQFSILLKAEKLGDVERFCDRLKYFILACSWGGYESLAFPIAALIDSDGNYSATSLPWNLIRFYVGLEDPEVLIEDLENALE
ncbi:MAG: aminotransferase class I/II-fold pyridoxal phosphate-dependent enzyme [Bacteroidota bacterium]